MDRNEEIDEEEQQYIKDVWDEARFCAKHRREQISEKADLIVERIKSGKATIQVKPDISELSEVPVGVVHITTEHDFLDDGKYEFTVVTTIGQFYQDVSYDPTVSEAFDAGYYTAMRMLQEGLCQVPEKDDDGHS